MTTNKMPGVTVAVFVLTYIDILISIVAGNGGFWVNLLFKAPYLMIVIDANLGKKWARIVWSVFAALGVLGSVYYAIQILASGLTLPNEVKLIFLVGLVMGITTLILLWHPKTSEWFDAQQSRG